MSKVSIIVPIYNVEKYLDRCIQSLLNQTLKDIEIILVNDGSPDKCPQICNEYAKQDQRIKVIHKENEGLGFARNSGLELASGEYIGFVDSDDYVDKNMFLKLYEKAKCEQADVVCCNYYRVYTNGILKKSNLHINQNTKWENEEINNYILGMIAGGPYNYKDRLYEMSVWHCIFKKDIIKNNKIKFLSEREYVSEDLPFQISFLKKSQKVIYINDLLYYYCVNDSSLTATFNTEKFKRFTKLFYWIRENTKFDKKSTLYSDRFFIGYTKAYLFRLINSKKEDKLEILKHTVNAEVWNTIKSEYKIKYLKMHTKLIYSLILKKHIHILYIILYLCVKIKKIKIL